MWPCELLWSRKNSASVHQDLNSGYIMERQRQLPSAWIPKWRWQETEVMSACNVGVKECNPLYPDWCCSPNIGFPPAISSYIFSLDYSKFAVLHLIFYLSFQISVSAVCLVEPHFVPGNSPASSTSPKNVSFTAGPYLNPSSPLEASLPTHFRPEGG